MHDQHAAKALKLTDTIISLTILALAFAPGVFWLWYFYKKDKLEPEPLHLIRNSFLWGMAAVIPAAVIEQPFVPGGRISASVISAPIVEELLKFLVVWLTIYRSKEFDEPMDGVVYAASAALGFASLENVFYLFMSRHEPGQFFVVVVMRAFLSVPAHALFSSMWGFALGFAKFADGVTARKLIVSGLLLSMVLHAAFNFACESGPFWALGMLVVVPVLWSLANRKIKQALAASRHITLPGDEPRSTDAS
jgi:protease PrsW